MNHAASNRQTRSPWVLLTTLVFTLGLLTACGGGGGGGVVTVTETDISAAAGGQAQSGDQKLALTFPAGAVAADSSIRIEKIAASDLGPNFDGIEVKTAYRFGPDGTQFAQPVQVKLALGKATIDPANPSVNLPVVLLDSNGTLDGLQNVVYEVDADTGEVTLTGELTHFSDLGVSFDRNDVSLAGMLVTGIPDSAFAYEPFNYAVVMTEIKANIDEVTLFISPPDGVVNSAIKTTEPIISIKKITDFTSTSNETRSVNVTSVCERKDEKAAILFTAAINFRRDPSTNPVLTRILDALKDPQNPSSLITRATLLRVSKNIACKQARDTDGDGLPSDYEVAVGTNPFNADSDGNGTNDGDEDFDGDGLTTLQEFKLNLNPLSNDTDGDGTPDGQEDDDNDGLNNIDELRLGTDPMKSDTDGGGVNDGQEVNTDNTDPLNPADDGKVARRCPESTGVTQTLTTGLKPLPTSRTGVEQIRFAFSDELFIAGSIAPECAGEAPVVTPTSAATPGFATIPGTTLMGCAATEQQWDCFDLVSNAGIDMPHFHEPANYQAVVLAVDAASTSTSAPIDSARVAVGVAVPGVFGFTGEAELFTVAQSKFTSAGLLETSAFDGQTVGGGYRANEILVAHKEEVSQFTLANNQLSRLFFLTDMIPSFLSGEVFIVSTYRHISTGPALVLTSGTQSTSNELYAINPVTKASQMVGGGLQQNKVMNTRQLRCLPPICAASHFGGLRDDGTTDPGGISIIRWTGTGDQTQGSIAGVVPMGDAASPSGVVGIDLIGDGRGNVAIAAAGFTSGVIYETVVDQNGAVLRSANQTVPAGCINPGHVQYVMDSQRLRLIATCYNSSSYVVLDSQLQ